MDEQARPRRTRPAVILPFVFLQSLGLELSWMSVRFLFREIKYEACQRSGQAHIPEYDMCHDTSNYTADVAVYLGIMTIISLIFLGPFGRLLDEKGGKVVMAASGLLHASGDMWLYLCASIPVLQSSTYPSMLAAVFKGVGGGFAVAQAAQWAFIVDASSSRRRSIFFGLSLLMAWSGYHAANLGLGFLLQQEAPKATRFMLAFWSWTVYALSVAGMLPDHQVLESDRPSDEEFPPWSLPVSFRAIVDPFILIFKDPALRRLAGAYFSTLLAMTAFDAMVPYAMVKLGMSPSETIIITLITSVIRGAALLCVLPLFVVIYPRLFRSDAHRVSPPTEPSEQSPLLPDAPPSTSRDPHVWKQELAMSRLSLLAGVAGMIAIFFRCPVLLLLGSIAASLSVAALPSLIALVSFQASPSKMGRILTGFAFVETLAVLLHTLPTLLTPSGRVPSISISSVWWIAAALFGSGIVLIMTLGTATHKEPVSES